MSWPVMANGVKKIQLEITNYCNARCSACAREKIMLGKLEPEILGINDNYVSYEQFVSWFDKDKWENLLHIDFCGNIDEPTTNPDLLKICKWILENNEFTQYLKLTISTNGGTRNKEFWQELGKLSNDYKSPGGYKRLQVIWGIDGLEDTNHIYRRNVKWEKLQENFRTYIKAGGRAMWQFIYFDHNEHQDELVKQRSIDEGFEKVKWRNTKRQDRGDTVAANKEKYVKDNNVATKKIVCKACHRPNYHGLDTGLFVTNKGHVMPCCWLGTEARLKEVYDTYGYQYDSKDNVLDGNKSFQDILESDWYTNLHKTIMAETWQACVQHCKENVIEAITDDYNTGDKVSTVQ